MRSLLSPALLAPVLLAALPTASAQGVVPPFQLSQTNPLPGIGVGPVPGSDVQQVHMIHLPADPPNVFLCGLTVNGLPAANGGVGGLDLLSGRYDVLTDLFTPDTDASALNTGGLEFGLTFHPSGLYAAFDRLPGPPQLASRPNLTSPWQIVGPFNSLPTQAYYDPALANVGGIPVLIHVLGNDLAMTPIDLATAAQVGPSVVIVQAAVSGSTANSPSPIVDSQGELIGLSHHDLLGSDNDHYMSMDLDPNTPSVLFNDTTTWTNNGAFVGGRFFDGEYTPAPYHVIAIDSIWHTGGRAPVGGLMELRVFSPPTSSGDVYRSWVFVAPGNSFLASGVPLPGVGGLVGLNNIAVSFSTPPHNNMNGETMVALSVPSIPSLAGVSIPLQAGTLNTTTGVFALGNTAAMSIY